MPRGGAVGGSPGGRLDGVGAVTGGFCLALAEADDCALAGTDATLATASATAAASAVCFFMADLP